MVQSILLIAICLLVGYYISVYISKPVEKNGIPRSNRLPLVKFKNVEILPNVRFHFRNKTYWFHHWFYLSLLIIVSALIFDNMIHSTTARAFASASVGGIIQGLRYPDRFQFRHPRTKK